MSAPPEVLKLIERFELHREDYQRGNYQEAQLRQEFINPMFRALGWDMDNAEGLAEAYKDVIHEDAIKIGGATKAPDYCFRIGGTRKFFLEAKKPSVNIKQDVGPAFQLRRYAWSAKLPLSVLTDFAELAVYDCRVKPDKKDKASTSRVMYVTYDQFSEKWDEIAAIFSKSAILKGSFDKFADSNKKKRGTAEVDSAFLDDIERWRAVLAKNIALRNSDITSRDLNFSVQRIIDRIVFLRIAEDRGMEDYGRLQSLLNGPKAYRRLTEIFRAADDRYNSGIFHFEKENGRHEEPDELTLTLAIDDDVLKGILRAMYYPESPYEFSVLPADILGQVYEQFLGKVIRLTAGHQAKIEEKPEVKKAGGVYYTPTYIVDYIVRQTVGAIVEGKTPRQVAKLRILDPACGSGSFLIGAYQFLLDWHLRWYAEHDPKKYSKQVFQGRNGEWQLTTAERKQILLNNIYGVDIDSQAVEVTKLSLLLKVLEGENRETIERQRKLFHERALPDLGNNIKWGNSLIGPDFYDHRQLSLFDPDEQYRINAFDWNDNFGSIMDAGGFDIVIGNPPWVSAWTSESIVREHLVQSEKELVGHWDLYVAFLLKAQRLVRANGFHAFVYPTSVLTEPYTAHIRQRLLASGIIHRIATFGVDRVFDKVSRKTCILILGCRGATAVHVDAFENGQVTSSSDRNPSMWIGNHNCLINLSQDQRCESIRQLIMAQSRSVGCIYYVNYGAQICSKEKGAFSQDFLLGKQSKGNAKKCLRGSSVQRYRLHWEGDFLDYQPSIMYGPRHPALFEATKIIVNKTSSKGCGIMATVDSDGFYCDQRLVLLVPFIKIDGTNLNASFPGYEREKTTESVYYHAGVLNSRLLSYYFKTFIATQNLQGDYTDVVPKMVRSLPLKRIDFSQPSEKKHHDRMTELVRRMLQVQKQLTSAKTGPDRTICERQVNSIDTQIDRLVYELYGLTEDEIRVIEEATAPKASGSGVEPLTSELANQE